MGYSMEASETIATEDYDFGKSLRLELNFKLKYYKYIFYIVRWFYVVLSLYDCVLKFD